MGQNPAIQDYTDTRLFVSRGPFRHLAGALNLTQSAQARLRRQAIPTETPAAGFGERS